MIQKIVIVGGGSAGWLTAGILAAAHKDAISITLVESPEVKTIGVGEGTWPTMRTTLQKIGIDETQFITQCCASFKQGSKFVGWKTGEVNDFYYHPFTLPTHLPDGDLYSAWQSTCPSETFADICNVQSRICEQGRAPKLISIPSYAGAMNYGYHLDAAKFVQLLQSHCIDNLHVSHLLDHVTAVNGHSDGSIKSITTKANGELAADLFIDCSGSKKLLIQDFCNIPFVSQRQYSINDRAIAIQVPYHDQDEEIASCTIATAQSSGWTWDIALTNRRGVGYVFSQAHIETDLAELELRNYIAQTYNGDVNELSSKTIDIECGHQQQFWSKNCVAIGMSAGFIEPLEASALALVELSANMIRDELPMTRQTMPYVSERFNRIFTYRWEKIVEFLKLHYVLSDRRDTQYWRDVTDESTIPQGLSQLLSLWKTRPPYFRDLHMTEEIFPVASYQYILFGMGFKSALKVAPSKNNSEVFERYLQENHKKLRNYCDNLPSNRSLINAVKKYGFSSL